MHCDDALFKIHIPIENAQHSIREETLRERYKYC